MCGGGPKGPSAVELQLQAEANAALIGAETDKIKAEQQAAKDAEDRKVMADNKAMVESDQRRKRRSACRWAASTASAASTPSRSSVSDSTRAQTAMATSMTTRPRSNEPSSPASMATGAVRMLGRNSVLPASTRWARSAAPNLGRYGLATVLFSCARRQSAMHSAQFH